MIVINKDKESEILILSQLDKDYETFTLSLYSAFQKKDITIDLGMNYSESIGRYSKFLILKNQYYNILSGEYEYKFLGDNEVLKFGLLNIFSTTDKVVYESIIPPANDNDIYVYQSK